MRKSVFAALNAAALSFALAGSAQALNARTWISGAGTDQASCGTIASPCRTLQFAHDNTTAGGQIDVKDSAGYGALTITKAISVVGTGSLAAALATAGATAITITAGTNDVVSLRGLTIDGGGVGYNGVVFFSGAKLEIADCVVQNFFFTGAYATGNGIVARPSSGSSNIAVVNTSLSNNGRLGLEYIQFPQSTASASILFDRITALNNQIGIGIEGCNSSGSTLAVITNSSVANNSGDGLYICGGTVSVDLSTFANNVGSGINLFSGTLNLGRSLSVNNGAFGLTHYGTINSYKDNRFTGNVSGPIGNPSNPGNVTLGTAPLY